jgi:hypothetical protein
MAWKLLLPWLRGLRDAGFEVHIACARAGYFDQLAADGFQMHDVPLRRRMNPLVHIAPLWALYRLIRRERFVVVNAHSPIAAAVGRVAAWVARAPVVIYTVHGFYFHDDMPRWKRRGYITLEWLLGRTTDRFMFVSDEDRKVALREGIARDAAAVTTIYNGVDLAAYPPKGETLSISAELRGRLDIPQGAPVVGIVGRVVREKGYLEFAEMAKLVSASRSDVYFLVVGDALPSDRDGIVAELRSLCRGRRSARQIPLHRFHRWRGGIPASDGHLRPAFVPGRVSPFRIGGDEHRAARGRNQHPRLPGSGREWRDGAHRAAAEWQGAGRGGKSLCWRKPELASRMGSAGRERAVRLYSHKLVQSRFVDVTESATEKQNPRRVITRCDASVGCFDVVISGGALIVLAPLLGAIALS